MFNIRGLSKYLMGSGSRAIQRFKYLPLISASSKRDFRNADIVYIDTMLYLAKKLERKNKFYSLF